jgi:hypothetical protein
MAEIPIPDNYKPNNRSEHNKINKLIADSLLTQGWSKNYKRQCNAKEVSLDLRKEYQKTVYNAYPVCPMFYPVCPVLRKMMKEEKSYSPPDIPKTNFPLLDSIIKILVVFEGITKLRPNEETVVRWAHSENLLAEQLDLIRSDLSALPKLLEKDFPDTSKECQELIAELQLAEFRYSMHGQSLVYLLPNNLKFGNWATFLQWREQQGNYAKLRGLSTEIEMCRLTRHYPAEAIKVMRKLYDELSPFLKILPEQAVKNNRLKTELKQVLDEFFTKPAETEGKANNKAGDSKGTETKTDLAKVPISELIKQGESQTLEFKETLEYDTEKKGKNKDILHSSLKTIAGFLNAAGGTLLIGVHDSGKIEGIERDLSIMKRGNNDRFEQKIRNCLKDRFEPRRIGKVNISFEKSTEGTICRVDIQASKEIVHLDGKVYVREGNTTLLLEGPTLTDWIQQRGN